MLSGENGAAAAFIQPRSNFMNLFGGTTDLALMEQELALNPHLLQRMTQDSELSAQLMKFNSELVGLGCNSNSSLLGGGERPSIMATPASFEATNSCDNSQDATHGRFCLEKINCDCYDCKPFHFFRVVCCRRAPPQEEVALGWIG